MHSYSSCLVAEKETKFSIELLLVNCINFIIQLFLQLIIKYNCSFIHYIIQITIYYYFSLFPSGWVYIRICIRATVKREQKEQVALSLYAHEKIIVHNSQCPKISMFDWKMEIKLCTPIWPSRNQYIDHFAEDCQ